MRGKAQEDDGKEEGQKCGLHNCVREHTKAFSIVGFVAAAKPFRTLLLLLSVSSLSLCVQKEGRMEDVLLPCHDDNDDEDPSKERGKHF